MIKYSIKREVRKHEIKTSVICLYHCFLFPQTKSWRNEILYKTYKIALKVCLFENTSYCRLTAIG